MRKWYGVVRWCAEDIKGIKPEWSLAKCRRWLETCENQIENACVMEGQSAISDLLQEED